MIDPLINECNKSFIVVRLDESIEYFLCQLLPFGLLRKYLSSVFQSLRTLAFYLSLLWPSAMGASSKSGFGAGQNSPPSMMVRGRSIRRRSELASIQFLPPGQPATFGGKNNTLP